MMGTPEGHVESIHEGEATPTNDLDDEDVEHRYRTLDNVLGMDAVPELVKGPNMARGGGE